MQLSLPQSDLAGYVSRQMSAIFPDRDIVARDLQPSVAVALERTEFCFSRTHAKYYSDGAQTVFNHLNTDQYATFLYFLANTTYKAEEDPTFASKLYALNKALHSIDAFYEVELPDIFLFQHPVGTVLGRGTYAPYLVVYQRCTVGANLEGDHPSMNEGVILFGGSAVIGNCNIGGNCWLSAGTLVMDTDLPGDSVVFGRSPELTIRPTRRDVVCDVFGQSRNAV